MKKLLVVVLALSMMAMMATVTTAAVADVSATGFFGNAEDGTPMVRVESVFTNNSGAPMEAQVITVPVAMADGTLMDLRYNIPDLADGESRTAFVSQTRFNILWGETGGLLVADNILWGETPSLTARPALWLAFFYS